MVDENKYTIIVHIVQEYNNLYKILKLQIRVALGHNSIIFYSLQIEIITVIDFIKQQKEGGRHLYYCMVEIVY